VKEFCVVNSGRFSISIGKVEEGTYQIAPHSTLGIEVRFMGRQVADIPYEDWKIEPYRCIDIYPIWDAVERNESGLSREDLSDLIELRRYVHSICEHVEAQEGTIESWAEIYAEKKTVSKGYDPEEASGIPPPDDCEILPEGAVKEQCVLNCGRFSISLSQVAEGTYRNEPHATIGIEMRCDGRQVLELGYDHRQVEPMCAINLRPVWDRLNDLGLSPLSQYDIQNMDELRNCAHQLCEELHRGGTVEKWCAKMNIGTMVCKGHDPEDYGWSPNDPWNVPKILPEL